MPSPLHEALVTLFRNCPTLAPGLMQARVEVPTFTEARIESADLTDVQPAEYRSDLVVVLRNAVQRPVLGVIVEVQLQRDPHKRLSWPAYAINLRTRLGCDTCVLVFSPVQHVARWAGQPIQLGVGSIFYPLALGPAIIPRILDPELARREPELAVLSAIAHARGDTQLAIQLARIALDAVAHLDDGRAVLYGDWVVTSLPPPTRKELFRVEPKLEYQSEWIRRAVGIGRVEGRAEGKAEGRAEGEASGRAAALTKLLAKKLGPLDPPTLARIQQGSLEELDTWLVRVLDATSLADVFDP